MWAIAIMIIPMDTVTILVAPTTMAIIITVMLIMVVIMIVILTETTGDYRPWERVH